MTNPYISRDMGSEEAMINPYSVENIVSHEKIYKSMPVDEEVLCKDTAMISETDTEDSITYLKHQSSERYFRSKYLYKCLT